MSYSVDTWERVKSLYKAGVPVSAIVMETGVTKTAIYNRASKHRWKRVEKGERVDIKTKVERRADAGEMAKTEAGRRILEEVEARKTLTDIEAWKATAPPAEVDVHNDLVLDRLTLERAFATSAMRNQQMTDQAILHDPAVREMGYASIDLLKKHAETTKLNKAVVLGGDPVVQINQGEGDQKSMVVIPTCMADGEELGEHDAVQVDGED
jgi:hypothetical protein